MKISKKILFTLFLMFLFLFINPFEVNADDVMDMINVEVEIGSGEGDSWTFETKSEGIEVVDKKSTWDKIFEEYKGFIIGIMGIVTMTFVIFFIINFMKLGAAGTNPQVRSQTMHAVLWTGIAAAGFGSVFLWVALFSNMIGSNFTAGAK